MQYDDELVLKLYKGYIEWIKDSHLDDNMDNYIYYIENVQTIGTFEKV